MTVFITIQTNWWHAARCICYHSRTGRYTGMELIRSSHILLSSGSITWQIKTRRILCAIKITLWWGHKWHAQWGYSYLTGKGLCLLSKKPTSSFQGIKGSCQIRRFKVQGDIHSFSIHEAITEELGLWGVKYVYQTCEGYQHQNFQLDKGQLISPIQTENSGARGVDKFNNGIHPGDTLIN